MSAKEYILHYVELKPMLAFFLITLLLLVICVSIIVLVVSLSAHGVTTMYKKDYFYIRSSELVERFYEMIFSGSSILSFLASYYIIERFVTEGSFRVFWDDHSDLLLLGMIITSCLLNTFLDRVLIPLRNIDKEEKASVRMIAMLYVILIFVYIKFIKENNNYDGFITYFLGLMIGRFVYFDASFGDFIASVKRAGQNLPLMVMGLAYLGIMCYIGFGSKYLLISNGVLVSTFIAHIFMVIAILIIHNTNVLRMIFRPTDKNSDGN